MKTTYSIIILFFLSFSFNSCLQEDIEQHMVHFDQAFIPVWYYTELENFAKADSAFKLFMQEWNTFKENSSVVLTTTKKWKISTNRIDNWIKDANQALTTKNKDLTLNYLDHARYELMDWRWKKGMDYFLDYVWDFEASLDIVLGSTPYDFDDPNRHTETQKNYTDLYISWESLKAQTPDPFLFHFTKKELELYNTQKQELETLLTTFSAQAFCHNTCEYEDATESLRFAYLSFLKTLGQFEELGTFYAEQ